jgi:hypothetical protein
MQETRSGPGALALQEAQKEDNRQKAIDPDAGEGVWFCFHSTDSRWTAACIACCFIHPSLQVAGHFPFN